MTALVLICPLQCAECCDSCWNHSYADSGSPACGSEADCDCTCDREQQLPCDDGRNGSKETDCFCHGAVLSVGTKCPDLDADCGFFDVVLMNGAHARQFAGTRGGDPAWHHGSHFPPLLSGRDICTLVNSYLL